MNWTIKRRLSVLGAPIMIVGVGRYEASIGVFDYPDGRRKVRVEVGYPGNVIKAAALASQVLDAARDAMSNIRGEHTAASSRTATGTTIVDITGPEALAIVLPYFGRDIVEAWAKSDGH